MPGTREKTSHRRLRWPSPGATAPCWLPGPCPLWAAVGVGDERGLGGRRQASERVVATAGGGGGLACFSGSSPAGRRAGQGCRAWATHRDPVCVVCRAAVPHHASSSPSYEATCRRPRRSPSRPRAGPGSAAGALPWQHKDSGGGDGVARAASDLRHLLALVALSSPCFATGALSKPGKRRDSQGRPSSASLAPPRLGGRFAYEINFPRGRRGTPCPVESS